MALVGKQEADVEIKAPADKFFNILRGEIHHIPNISSDKVHGVEVHEGDWETSGSVKLWKFTSRYGHFKILLICKYKHLWSVGDKGWGSNF